MGKSTISMAILNSYVKLPEGIWSTNQHYDIPIPAVPLWHQAACFLLGIAWQTAGWRNANTEIRRCIQRSP